MSRHARLRLVPDVFGAVYSTSSRSSLGPRSRSFLGGGIVHSAYLLSDRSTSIGSDRLEREAEWVAGKVAPIPTSGPALPVADGPATGRAGGGSADGRSIGREQRALFEPRFGYSFRNVRIHTGERAAAAARLLNAQAFTSGPDIMFGRDQYRPSTASGRQLIAHELAHVVQQGAAAPRMDRGGEALVAPSHVRGVPLIQRRPVPPATVAGLNLGPLAVMEPESVEPTGDPSSPRILRAVGPTHLLTATDEAVPGDDQAGVFPGFTAPHEAQGFAIHEPEITMIVSDPDPRFHVLHVSGAPRTPNPVRSNRLSRYLRDGLTISRAVNPHLRVATRDPSWAAREAHARWLRRQYRGGPRAGDAGLWDEMRRAYIRLAVDACGASPEQIHVMENGTEAAVRPGLINIDVFTEGATIGSGLSGPARLDPGAAHAQQRQWFLINWQRFRTGLDAVRSTYRHETIHLGTRERVLTLIEQWQQAQRPLGSLHAWLEVQQRLPQGGSAQVTERDLYLARAHTHTGSRQDRPDESLTAAMTFMTVFHTISADQIDPVATFTQLRYMLTNWRYIGEADFPGFRRHILDSLHRYYRQRLDAPHRAAFDAWIDRRLSSGSGSGPSGVADALRYMRGFRNGP